MPMRARREASGGGGTIAAKLGVVVVGFALIAAGLLAVRQRRVQIASELMRTHLETQQTQQAVLRLRTEIAAGETIDRIQQMATSGTDLVPLAFVVASEQSPGEDAPPPTVAPGARPGERE